MAFSSAFFLFVFLPIIYIIYVVLSLATKGNTRVLNGLLLCASILFYSYGEPVFVVVMVAVVLINSLLARQMIYGARYKKIYLIIGVVLDLGQLVIFKYLVFFCQNVMVIFGIHFEINEIHLPVGISFFTFQILSYIIDVYRNDKNYQKSLGKVLLYVSFFPQLVAGPIIKYHDVQRWIEYRKLNSEEVAEGICRFIIGLSKKVLIADSLGRFVDVVYDMPLTELPTVLAWVGAVSYALQIYYDFSGYSDMAIGLGHMFGFTFEENFKNPFQSCSIREFWRRWHISLSSWFREYLYIPLGGNRKGRVSTEKNKLIVFFFTGLWHGASWNFILWGMIHGVALVIEDVLHRGRKPSKIRDCIGWLYTMLIVCVAFVWFRAESFGQGWHFVVRMFFVNPMTGIAKNQILPFMTPHFIMILIISLLGCLPFVHNRKRYKGGYALSIVLYVLCLSAIAGESYNPFIYFRF